MDRIPTACAAVVLAVGTFSLIGWTVGVKALAGDIGDVVPMKVNTALAFIGLAIAVLLLRPHGSRRRRRAGEILAAAVAAFGLFVVGEYLIGGTPVDTLLSSDPGARYPGRPAQQVAVTLLTIGVALATLRARPRLSTALTALSTAMVTFTVVGYLDGVDFLRGDQARFGVAVNSIGCLIALVAALTALAPDRGLAGLLRGPDAGARMARVVLPISVTAAIVFRAADAWVERQAISDAHLSDAVYTLTMVLSLVVVVAFAARTLRRADERQRELARIVETAHDGIITNGPDGRIMSWNAAAERILGYRADEMIGRSIALLTPPGVTDAATGAHGLSTAVELETQRLARDGRVVEVALSVTPMHDVGGKAITSTIVRDITAEKAAEAERRRLSAVVESSADAVVSIDTDGCFTSWNPGAGVLLGYTEAEILGRPVTTVIPPARREEYQEMMTGVAGGQSVIGWQTQRLHKDGTAVDVEITASPLADEHGRRTGATAIIRDTRERQEASRRFELLLEAAPDGMLMVDEDGRIVRVNAQIEQVFGYRREELIGAGIEQLVPDMARDRHVALRTAYVAHPEVRVMRGGVPLSGRAKDGTEVPVEISLSPLRTPQGLLVIAAVRDVRERRAAERALAASEELFRRSFRDSGIGMALVGLDGPGLGHVLEVNEALSAITRYPPDELRAMEPMATVHPDDLPALAEDFVRLSDGTLPLIRREARMIDAKGATLWAAITVSLVRDSDGAPLHVVVQVQDVSDRKRFEGQLQHLADHDALTGLFNRRRFEEELMRELASSQRYGTPGAVIVLDLDHFKVVNDTLGHAAGDQLIKIVAEVVRTRLRETDVLCRMGGDEFAIILPRAGVEESRTLGETLLREIRDDARAATTSGVGRVTASIGVAPFGPGSRALGADDVLAQADIAMYDAKEDGRDRVAVYDAGEARHTRMQARVTWVSRIERALEQERFVLHAQPIVAVSSQDPTRRYELLLRMVGEGGDLIPPGTFLHVAERSDLAQRIDRWVVTQAVELLAAQQQLGRDVAFSVNLSGRSVNDPATLEHIVSAIAANGVDPARLTFEVTETAAIVNIASATQFARRLREIGCRLALDDFGAGFASFYYLKHLTFDFLKIDGEFIKDLPSSRTNQLVVRSVVDIARGMGKTTVAEFVGDEATMELLAEYGVDFAQGYFLGRPEPLAQALERRDDEAGPPPPPRPLRSV